MIKYKCIRKCFFNNTLYDVDEEMEQPKEVAVPRHFEKIEEKKPSKSAAPKKEA